MSKLKAGDLVRLVDSRDHYGWIMPGQTYTLKKILPAFRQGDGPIAIVEDKYGNRAGCYLSRFERAD